MDMQKPEHSVQGVTSEWPTGGMELFCRFSIPFFMKLQDRGNYTVATMEKLLKDCFENVEGPS
jgi:hypothetical protein